MRNARSVPDDASIELIYERFVVVDDNDKPTIGSTGQTLRSRLVECLSYPAALKHERTLWTEQGVLDLFRINFAVIERRDMGNHTLKL